MNDKLFSVNYRNQHLDEANKITIDDLNFQAYRPDEDHDHDDNCDCMKLEPIHQVPNPAGTFSHPDRRFPNN
jgi:hypothetical protein